MVQPVGDLSGRNFGLLIAYVIPGFVGLWGLAYVSEPVRLWLTGATPAGPSVAGVLFVLVASVGCGMTASAVRWVVVDTAHHVTGLPRPAWDDTRLPERLEAFEALVENHFRYYQFYANSATAGVSAYAAWRCSPASADVAVGAREVVLLMLLLVLIAGSRDALRRYYSRTALLLGTVKGSVDDDERTQPRNQDPEEPVQAGDDPLAPLDED